MSEISILACVASQITTLRRKVCPKSSYTTSGSAALLIIVSEKMESKESENLSDFQNSVLQTHEFESVQQFSNAEEAIAANQGNVLLLYGYFSSSDVSKLEDLLVLRKSKLIVHFQSVVNAASDTTNDIQSAGFTKIVASRPDLLSKYVQRHGNNWQLQWTYMDRNATTSKEAQLTKAFNTHPAVRSKSQFSYLWSRDFTIQKDFGKLRVLQRLANNFSGVSTSRRVSEKEWDEIITDVLKSGGNDFHVYSEIRQRMLGSSLDEALKIDLDGGGQLAAGEDDDSSLDNTSAAAAAASSVRGADAGLDERAGHMVKTFIDCIPSNLLSTGDGAVAVAQCSISRVLDYGCAEGKITAEFARQLKNMGVSLAAEDVFGADVRSVSTGGEFTFVPLPPENPDQPPDDGKLLSGLAEGSIDVVIASMVFHHVIHVEHVMRELRRVISSRGVLLLREHDCRTPDVGAFLDITHGLFSLSWCKEVEWPDFLEEYEAYYRSKEEWNSLMEKAGFVRLSGRGSRAAPLYTMADGKPDSSGHINNVIRAYYAVYAPNPKYNPDSSINTRRDDGDDGPPVIEQKKKFTVGTRVAIGGAAGKTVAGAIRGSTGGSSGHVNSSITSISSGQKRSREELEPVRIPSTSMAKDVSSTSSSSSSSTAVAVEAVIAASTSLNAPGHTHSTSSSTAATSSVHLPQQQPQHLQSSASEKWMQCESKSHPGQFYMFNTKTGERRWVT